MINGSWGEAGRGEVTDCRLLRGVGSMESASTVNHLCLDEGGGYEGVVGGGGAAPSNQLCD